MALLLSMGGLLLVAGGGTAATLWSLGYFQTVAAGPDRTGKVAYIISSRPISALHRVTREDVFDLTKQQFTVTWLSPEEARPEMLRDPGLVIGRVAARDKPAGYAFTERDFLPKGSREGVAGGVPAGKVALPIDVKKVRGMHILRSGDQFDLLVAIPIDLQKQLPQIRVGLGNDSMEGRDKIVGTLQKRATIQLLVENAVVVTPSGSGSEATIAVSPEEIGPLTKALTLSTDIFCVARSGQPSDSIPYVQIETDREPLRDLAIIETLQGKNRSLEVFVTNEANSAGVPPAPPKAESTEAKPLPPAPPPEPRL